MATDGDQDQKQLNLLQGVVCYALVRNDDGQEELDATWVSTRTVDSDTTGTGKAVRADKGASGWTGDWHIQYLDPSGDLAVMTFALRLEKRGQLFHGAWSTLDGKPLLTGFGFEDRGKLLMRYGM